MQSSTAERSSLPWLLRTLCPATVGTLLRAAGNRRWKCGVPGEDAVSVETSRGGGGRPADQPFWKSLAQDECSGPPFSALSVSLFGPRGPKHVILFAACPQEVTVAPRCVPMPHRPKVTHLPSSGHAGTVSSVVTRRAGAAQ